MAADLGEDADELMTRVAGAARTIAWDARRGVARVAVSLTGSLSLLGWRSRDRAPGVVLRDGEVCLEPSADPAADPLLAAPGGGSGRREAGPARTRHARPAGRPCRAAARARGRPRRVRCSSTCCWRPPRHPGHRGARPERLLVPAAARVGAGPQPAAAQRLPPLHRRPAPVRDRRQRRRARPTGSTGPTCSWSAPCSTTSARATRGDHTEVGIELVAHDRAAPRVPAGRRRRARRWCATTCCCPTWPPAATSTTTRPSRRWPRRSASIGHAQAARRAHRGRLAWPPVRRRGDRGRPSWSPSSCDRTAGVLEGGSRRRHRPRGVPDRGAAARCCGPGEPFVRRRRATRCSVVTPDRPGLFSRVAGVLALHGLDVLAADASQRRRHGARAVPGHDAASAATIDWTGSKPTSNARSTGGWPSRPAWPSGRSRTRPASTAGRQPAASCASTTTPRPSPRSSRSTPPTRSACSTGSPGRSPSSTSTSAPPRCRRSATRSSTPSTCCDADGQKITDPDAAEIERAILHAIASADWTARDRSVRTSERPGRSPSVASPQWTGRPTQTDLLRWSEALAGIARTGLGFTESLYERERFEEVLRWPPTSATPPAVEHRAARHSSTSG